MLRVGQGSLRFKAWDPHGIQVGGCGERQERRASREESGGRAQTV